MQSGHGDILLSACPISNAVPVVGRITVPALDVSFSAQLGYGHAKPAGDLLEGQDGEVVAALCRLRSAMTPVPLARRKKKRKIISAAVRGDAANVFRRRDRLTPPP